MDILDYEEDDGGDQLVDDQGNEEEEEEEEDVEHVPENQRSVQNNENNQPDEQPQEEKLQQQQQEQSELDNLALNNYDDCNYHDIDQAMIELLQNLKLEVSPDSNAEQLLGKSATNETLIIKTFYEGLRAKQLVSTASAIATSTHNGNSSLNAELFMHLHGFYLISNDIWFVEQANIQLDAELHAGLTDFKVDCHCLMLLVYFTYFVREACDSPLLLLSPLSICP